MTIDQLPHVQLARTGTIHAVFADGSPEDGSLHGFRTLCGLDVYGDTSAPANDWREVATSADCGLCRRVLRAEEPPQ